MTRKNNQKAFSLRQEGNKLYNKKEFLASLLKYNESLCNSDQFSDHRGHAFANRSAVYFEMKLFSKSLSNIEKALQNHYPENCKETLLLRQEKCKKLLSHTKHTFKNQKDFFQLSFPSNEKVPFISNCLQLNEDSKYGRYITSNIQLNVGDVIALEKPYISVTIFGAKKKSNDPGCNIYQRCCNCLADNQLDLIPCDECCYGIKKIPIKSYKYLYLSF